MSKLRFVSRKTKVLVFAVQALAIISSIICLVLNYTNNYNQAVYISLGCVIPTLCLIISFFPLFNAYTDRATDLTLYILTAVEVIVVILFIVTAFLSR